MKYMTLCNTCNIFSHTIDIYEYRSSALHIKHIQVYCKLCGFNMITVTSVTL
jgi:RNase P subunit RPR2